MAPPRQRTQQVQCLNIRIAVSRRERSGRERWHGFEPAAVITSQEPLLSHHDRVMSAGSCFASNLIPWLERSGIDYVRTEVPPPAFDWLPENLGYRNFSAAYGNIYTARHLRQLLERCLTLFAPAEDRWYQDPFVIDPFRPGLRYPARSDEEFDLLTRQHLDAVVEAIRGSTVLVFTLGLTEGVLETRWRHVPRLSRDYCWDFRSGKARIQELLGRGDG